MFDMVFDWGGIKNSIIESVNESRNDMKTIEANLGEQIKNEIAATMKAVRENKLSRREPMITTFVDNNTDSKLRNLLFAALD